MSHYKLLVTQTNKFDAAKQLAPFEEVEGHDLAHRKWDWCEVGGRWHGYFKLRPGAVGRLGLPGAYGNKPRYDADVANAGDVDWPAMRAAEKAARERAWRKYERAKKVEPNANPAELRWRFEIREEDDHDSYVARPMFALDAVLYNGVWYESPLLTWLIGGAEGARPSESWEEQPAKILTGLAPDDELTFVDFHR